MPRLHLLIHGKLYLVMTKLIEGVRTVSLCDQMGVTKFEINERGSCTCGSDHQRLLGTTGKGEFRRCPHAKAAQKVGLL